MQIILVLNCFLVSPKMTLLDTYKEDPVYTKSLSNPQEVQHRFVTMPKALNRPVHSLDDRLEEIDMYATGPVMLIQDHLTALLQCSTVEFREQICQWMSRHVGDVGMIEKWLAVHGLSLQEYFRMLGEGTASDGLEVWATSMALNCPLNIVMEDCVVYRQRRDRLYIPNLHAFHV